MLVKMLSFDGEGRAILTEHTVTVGAGGVVRGEEVGVVVVVNVYCPMVDRENMKAERLDYKMQFYSILRSRCSALQLAGK